MNSEIYKKALNYCLRLILLRNRTKAEIKNKLREKGYKEVTDNVLKQLISWGYLDDRKYAENYIISKQSIGKGKNKIYYGLLNKGVTKDDALAALEVTYCTENEQEKINEIATKKIINLLKRYPSNLVYNKLFRFLLGRGFSPSNIKNWLDNNFQAFLDNIPNKL